MNAVDHITAVDGVATTMFWTHELFDPERPDTYAEPVRAQP